jgi:hypothetical protein
MDTALIDWWMSNWVRVHRVLMLLSFKNGTFVSHTVIPVQGSPDICLSEAKASHSQRLWAKVSSYAPRLIHCGLLVSPIQWRCLLRVLCPVRRPVTWIMSCQKTQFWSFNSQACLWVLLRPCHLAKCWLSSQWIILLLIFCLETPKDSSDPNNFEQNHLLWACWQYHFPVAQHVQGPSTAPQCAVEISFNAFWHCRTNGDVVLAAWRAFRATWLSEQILTYFPGLTFVWIS